MDRKESFISKLPQHAARPGFEIWFAVVIDKVSQKALWVRYTTFSPVADSGYHPRAVMWASLFDAVNPANHCYGAASFPLEQVIATDDGYHYPTGRLSLDQLSGAVPTPKGQLRWDLRYQHQFEASQHTPPFIENSFLRRFPKTKSIACSPFAKVQGEIGLNGSEYAIRDAGGVLTHIWGTTRIDTLCWLFVPVFDDDGEEWSLEIASVKVKPFLPSLTFMTLAQRGTVHHDQSFRTTLSSSARLDYPRLEFRVTSPGMAVQAQGSLAADQVTAYIYRDPDGTPRYIEQSDVGEVVCIIQKDGQERRLVSRHGAAVEFHGPAPWSAREYLDPYKP